MSIADIKEGTDVNVFSSDKICCGGKFFICRSGCEIVKKTGQGAKDFRPYDQLMFQVVIPPVTEHVGEPDDVEICKLVVTFGENESEMWEWSQTEGTSSWTKGSHWDGANTSWLLLKRVSKMARS